MKIEKLSLDGVKNVLSRTELKKIMAGSGGSCLNCGVNGAICCDCSSGGINERFIICNVTCAVFCEINYPGWMEDTLDCSGCNQ